MCKGVLETMEWVPRTVKMSYATCAIDGPSLDHVSFITMLDEASNAVMMRWVEEVEAAIKATLAFNT